jgi:7-carboxy-7-deazaguanine synthase
LALLINELFASIQGEGVQTGIPMFFIRLQGCEVGCYFCDTKHSWRKSIASNSPYKFRDESFIIDEIKKHSKNIYWVCITGGEPLEQNISPLLKELELNNFMSHVETSGTCYGGSMDSLTEIDWLALSPKDLFSKKKTLPEFKELANEIKVVVTKESDIDYYINNYYNYTDTEKPLIFQPVDNNQKLIDPILKKMDRYDLLNCRLMIQQHKIFGVR